MISFYLLYKIVIIAPLLLASDCITNDIDLPLLEYYTDESPNAANYAYLQFREAILDKESRTKIYGYSS